MWEQYDDGIFFINDGEDYIIASILNDDENILKILNSDFKVNSLDFTAEEIEEKINNSGYLIVENVDIIEYDDEDYLDTTPYLRDVEIIEKFISYL